MSIYAEEASEKTDVPEKPDATGVSDERGAMEASDASMASEMPGESRDAYASSAGAESADAKTPGESGQAGGQPDAADWKKLYEEAKRELEDREELAALSAEYPFLQKEAQGKERYEKFKSFRSMGLSVREAYFAANSGSESFACSAATKRHLSPVAPRAYSSARSISAEELRVAQELLGDGYGPDEIDALYRRITKNQ